MAVLLLTIGYLPRERPKTVKGGSQDIQLGSAYEMAAE